MSAMPNEDYSMTEAEYLAFERASEVKHEYIGGEVFAMIGASRAMAGASEAHNLLCTSISFVLYSQLRKRPCKIYPSDMRVKVLATGDHHYPDISIVCEKPSFADNIFDTLLNPIVLIEVLSPSTEAYDRGKKFQSYRQIPSLREYLLISQDSPHIERYLLNDNGKWELSEAIGLESSLELSSIDCVLTLADVYEKVDFESEEK